jgi:hypothetical protein
MDELIKQARAEGKWLWCHYQDIWFSPDQIELEQSQGRFRWGPVNWKLRDPKERLQEAERRRDAAQAEVERVAQQIA